MASQYASRLAWASCRSCSASPSAPTALNVSKVSNARLNAFFARTAERANNDASRDTDMLDDVTEQVHHSPKVDSSQRHAHRQRLQRHGDEDALSQSWPQMHSPGTGLSQHCDVK